MLKTKQPTAPDNQMATPRNGKAAAAIGGWAESQAEGHDATICFIAQEKGNAKSPRSDVPEVRPFLMDYVRVGVK